jgi:hypothetical protein
MIELVCLLPPGPRAKQVLAGPQGRAGLCRTAVRTTAYVLCAGTLLWSCVAPCSSKLDRLDDGAGSQPPEHYGDGLEGPAGRWPMKLEPTYCVSTRGSSPPARVQTTEQSRTLARNRNMRGEKSGENGDFFCMDTVALQIGCIFFFSACQFDLGPETWVCTLQSMS